MKILHTYDMILADLCKAYEVSNDSGLAQKLGVSKQTVHQARRIQHVPEKWLIRAAMDTGVSIDRLVFGADCVIEGQRKIPIVSATLSAGGGSLETEGDIVGHYAFDSGWLSSKGNPEKMVLMRVSGDSMTPLINNGDMVLVDEGNKCVVSHSIYAIGIDEGIFVKELFQKPGHILSVVSVNREQYPPMDIDMTSDLAESVRIIGKVVWWCHEV